jgi:hypothetical protein
MSGGKPGIGAEACLPAATAAADPTERHSRRSSPTRPRVELEPEPQQGRREVIG